MRCIFLSLLLIICQTQQPLVCLDVKAQSDCKDVINGVYERILYFSNECMWTANGCVNKKCELMTPPCDSLVYENTACATSGTNCVSVTDCTQINNLTSCGAVKAGGQTCIWDTTCRVKKCQDYDQANCNQSNSDYCFFKDSSCQTVENCSEVTTQTLCESISLSNKCQWINNICDNFSCGRITESYQCYSTITTDNSCFNGALDNSVKCMSCSDHKEQCDCDKYSIFGCNWNESLKKCYRQSCEDYPDQSSCASAFDKVTCVWYSQLNQCTSITKANDLDRQCDLYVSSQILAAIIFIYLTL